MEIQSIVREIEIQRVVRKINIVSKGNWEYGVIGIDFALCVSVPQLLLKKDMG